MMWFGMPAPVIWRRGLRWCFLVWLHDVFWFAWSREGEWWMHPYGFSCLFVALAGPPPQPGPAMHCCDHLQLMCVLDVTCVQVVSW